MVASNKFIIFLISFVAVFNIAKFAIASDYNIRREYVIDSNIDDVLRSVRNYENYPKLFDNIKKVEVHGKNSSRDVVYFDIKVLRKEFGALLEFRKYSNYGRTSYRINCIPVKLYNMDYLDGNLHISRVSQEKTKIRIEANIKPSVFIPEFILENMIRREINEAINNLEKLANKK